MKLTEAQGACRCYATGLGVQPKGVYVGDKAVFKVHTQVPVNGGFSVKIISPDGSEVGAAVSQITSVVYECSYIPRTKGIHQVIVKYCDQLIANGPFEVDVTPAWRDCVRAFGPGLRHGVVGFPASFTMETYEESLKPLRVHFDNKPDVMISSNENEDGSTDVSYLPLKSGHYWLNILNCKGEAVACSPYLVSVRAKTRTFDPTKVEASGSGLNEIGNTANKWAEFKVDTKNAGEACLEIGIFDADGLRVRVYKQDKKNLYSCKYRPLRNGKHTVLINFGDVAISKSPYRVFVQDPEKLKFYGPAIDFPLKIFQPTYFIMDCSEAGTGDTSCSMTNEKDLEPLFNMRSNGDNTYRCDFEPTQRGIYVAKIHFAGRDLPARNFKINTALEIDVSRVEVEDFQLKARGACRCYTSGLGVRPKGVHVGDEALFKVHTQVPVNGGFSIRIIGPDGSEMGAAVSQITSVAYECSYIPRTSGIHQVTVKYRDQPVANSPFEVEVEPTKEVWVFGTGLRTGVVGFPASFTMETYGEILPLSFNVPDLRSLGRKDYSCKSVEVSYCPLTPGERDVHVLNSTYKAIIKPRSSAFDPTKVKASGSGLRTYGNIANRFAEFEVDTRKAGMAHLQVIVYDVDRAEVKVTVRNEDGLHSCQYMPRKGGKHTVLISFGDVAIPESPYRVFISDPSKVKVYGPAIDHPVKIFQPTYLIVDYSEAGPGSVQSSITKEGSKHLVVRRDYKDKTLRIDIEATEVGFHYAKISFGNVPLPGSPYQINATLNTDVSKVKVEGFQLRIPAGDMASFDIITKDAGEGQAQVKVSGPSGKLVAVNIEETADGFEAKFTPIEIGLHSVQVLFAGQAVPQSPFRCETFRKDEDAKKVKAYGSGLNGGEAKATAEFIIDTREVDQVSLSLVIKGPCEPDISYVDNRDGTYSVCYEPTEPGEYLVDITCDGTPIDESPFKVVVLPRRGATPSVPLR